MDHYLPLTEEEIGNLKKAVEELDDSAADHQVQMCLDRINNLSSKLRQRAYMMALSKLRMARRNTQESLCQLHQTINLIGEVQHEDHPEKHQSFRKLSAITVEWTQRHDRHTIQAPFRELKEAESQNEEVGVRLAESSRIAIGAPLAESTRIEFEAPLAESTGTGIGAPLAESTRIEFEAPLAESPKIGIGAPLAESTRIEFEAPLAQSTGLEEIGQPLAQSSSIESTPEISHPEPTPPPAETTPEKAMTPPAERSSPEQRATPPPETSGPGHVSLPAPQSLRPEQVTKPAPSLPEHILRDMANITVTSPGCDKQDQLASETSLPAEEADMLPSEMEEKALEMSRSLAHNLHGTYENLLAHLKDLPEELQKKLYQTCRDMADLRSDFDSAHHFGDLSRGLLNKSFEVLAEAQCSMDELMEYALQSPKALLWLKDHLPNLEDQEQVLREDVPLPAKEEEEVVTSVLGKKGQDQDILKIQEAYDPQGCKEDTLPGEEEPAAPSAGQRRSEDILEIQRAQDPQGCKEEEPQATENQADRPAGEPAWNLTEMLQRVFPKAPAVEDIPGQAEVVPPPEEQEVGERNILEIQQAQDPQGCKEDTLPGEEEPAAPLAGQRRSEDILEIQRAQDPQGCKEEEPQVTENQADRPAGEPAWNLTEMLQRVFPKAPAVEDVPGQAEVVPPPEEQEVGKRNILEIQRAQDPQGCKEEEPQVTENQADQPVEQPAWNLTEMLQRVLPKAPAVEDVSGQAEVIPPPEEQEVGERNILEIQRAQDPQGCKEEEPQATENQADRPAGEPAWNLTEMLQRVFPKAPAVEDVPGQAEVVLPPEEQEVGERNILEIQRAQDPQGCKEEEPQATENQADQPVGQPAWNLTEMLQRVLPKAPAVEDVPGQAEVVLPPEEQEVGERNILEIQRAQDPKGCDEEPLPGEQEVVPPSSEWELEGLLKIEEAYDPQGCDEGPLPRKEGEVVTPSEWKIVKFLQAYAPKMHTEEASSPKKTVEVVAPLKEETRDSDGLKAQKAHHPTGCDEDGPSENEGTDWEGPFLAKRSGREILKIQEAQDPKGCEDETLSIREKTEASPSSEQEEWRFLKILQSYIPRSRNNGASPGAEAKAPPAPGKWEGKEGAPEGAPEGVPPPPGNLEPPRWDILKIQEAQDPKGCEEDEA
ncbi:uncharacterized protein LOC110079313 [Pogona vitticeps]